MKKTYIIVIGGGAAGFFGAIRAKRLNSSLQVVLLEAAAKPLSKVKISGGGRCNVTTACFDIEQLMQYYPRCHPGMLSVFSRFGPRETVAWFKENGVPLKTESDGRIFPISDDSQTIIDCLLEKARSADVRVITKCPVHKLLKKGNEFLVHTSKGTWMADAVLLATGSARKGLAWALDFGHSVILPVPSLFTFQIKDPLLADLAGVGFNHVRGCLKLPREAPIIQEGPLLITHWGLSGPLILKLSAWGARLLFHAHYCGDLFLDFLPGIDQDTLHTRLYEQQEKNFNKQIGNNPPFDLPKRFWQSALILEGVSPDVVFSAVRRKSLRRVAGKLKHYPFQIKGKGIFKEEFVTAGGVSLNEINFKSMESCCTPGLYFAGELLNVDGLTGGFNFQNAWSTGWVAGDALSRRFLP